MHISTTTRQELRSRSRMFLVRRAVASQARLNVVPSAQVFVHEVHSVPGGLKKANVKQSRISLLWCHELVIHQC